MMTTIDLESGVASAYQERVVEIQGRKPKEVRRPWFRVHSTSFVILRKIAKDMAFTQPHLSYLVSQCNRLMEVRQSAGGAAFDSALLGKPYSRDHKDVYHDNLTFTDLVFRYLKA